MSKPFFTILALTAYLFVVGCGTTGPLYIPEQRYPQKTQEEAPKTPDATTTNKTTNE